MQQLYRTKLWEAILPDGWRAKSCGDEYVTLWNPEGVGTLTVFTRNENDAPPRNSKGKSFNGKLHGTSFDYSGDDLFGRHWCLLCGGQWLYAHYSCAAKNAERERAEVDEILQSISESR
jgi:hypothetical protein